MPAGTIMIYRRNTHDSEKHPRGCFFLYLMQFINLSDISIVIFPEIMLIELKKNNWITIKTTALNNNIYYILYANFLNIS